MISRFYWKLNRILDLLAPGRGYKRARYKAFPETSYARAGAYPVRRATRLP